MLHCIYKVIKVTRIGQKYKKYIEFYWKLIRVY